MQKFRPDSVNKICLTLLSLTLLTQTVIGSEFDKVSYLDSVASSYIQQNQTPASNIINAYSPEAQGFEATFKLDSIPVITNSTARINLSLRESDLRQALRMIADKAGLNIVFDQSVDGKITLDLNNVTLNDAFLIIFKSTQLSYTLDGNTITVMTLNAAKNIAYTRQNMTLLPIKYVNANAVATFLNENLFKSNIFGLSNQPIVTSNPRTNQIVVFGSMSDVNAIKRILPVIDTKPMVNSFKVNHTTPAEMASLICSSLFYSKGEVSVQGGSESDDKLVLGAGYVACRDEGEGNSSGNDKGLKSFEANPLTVTYFPELGTINTYGGTVEQIETIKEFIKEHDKKQLMAYIELSIIELNDAGSKSFNNTWNLWTPFISLGLDNGTFKTTSPFLIWDRDVPSGIIKSNNKGLLYELTYLIENRKGRILHNPKIMVTNGKTAIIDMTEDYVKSVTSQILQGSDSVTSASQRTYDIGSDQGLLIEILPFISPEGYVSMNITPEFATLKDQISVKNPETNEAEIQATLLQRRDLELKNVRIRDGETLVLAGMIKEDETQSTAKMPILSDLPFIGAFFRNSRTDKTRSELVILVTPHIVNDSNDSTGEKIYDL